MKLMVQITHKLTFIRIIVLYVTLTTLSTAMPSHLRPITPSRTYRRAKSRIRDARQAPISLTSSELDRHGKRNCTSAEEAERKCLYGKCEAQDSSGFTFTSCLCPEHRQGERCEERRLGRKILEEVASALSSIETTKLCRKRRIQPTALAYYDRDLIKRCVKDFDIRELRKLLKKGLSEKDTKIARRQYARLKKERKRERKRKRKQNNRHKAQDISLENYPGTDLSSLSFLETDSSLLEDSSNHRYELESTRVPAVLTPPTTHKVRHSSNKIYQQSSR